MINFVNLMKNKAILNIKIDLGNCLTQCFASIRMTNYSYPSRELSCVLRQNLLLDQNALRSQELRSLALNSNHRFIIPDELLLEMCKSDKWESVLTQSFEIRRN